MIIIGCRSWRCNAKSTWCTTAGVFTGTRSSFSLGICYFSSEVQLGKQIIVTRTTEEITGLYFNLKLWEIALNPNLMAHT